MPRYTLTARSYLNGSLSEAGDVVEYAGWPGSALEPADDVAVRIKAAFAVMRKKGKTEPRMPDLTKFAGPAPEKDDKDA